MAYEESEGVNGYDTSSIRPENRPDPDVPNPEPTILGLGLGLGFSACRDSGQVGSRDEVGITKKNHINRFRFGTWDGDSGRFGLDSGRDSVRIFKLVGIRASSGRVGFRPDAHPNKGCQKLESSTFVVVRGVKNPDPTRTRTRIRIIGIGFGFKI